jgi:P27 family predicted phage terminase small subunit
MRPGTRPKATRLKLLSGNPGKRPLNEREPQPTLVASLPKPPRHLSPAGREEWLRVGSLLLRTRVLTEADLTALSAYATVYGRWMSAELEIKRKGILVPAAPRSKFRVQNPMLSVANKAFQQMSQLLGEFGLTPSSRTRIISSPASEDYEEKRKAEKHLGPQIIRPTPPR